MLEIEVVRKITKNVKEKLIIAEEEEIDKYIKEASQEGCNAFSIPELLYDENVAKYRKAGYRVEINHDGCYTETIIKW